MVRHDGVGPVADPEVVDALAARAQVIDLSQQHPRVDHYAVSYDSQLAWAKDPRRQMVQLVQLLTYLDAVARIVASLEPDDDVRLVRKVVDYLALPLVAPLRTYDGQCRHVLV